MRHKNFFKILVSVIKWFASYIKRLFFSVGLVHERICPFFSFVDRMLRHRKKRTRNFLHILSTRFPKLSVSQFQHLWVFRLPARLSNLLWEIRTTVSFLSYREHSVLGLLWDLKSTWRIDLKCLFDRLCDIFWVSNYYRLIEIKLMY